MRTRPGPHLGRCPALRLLQAEDVVEEGALQDGRQQRQLLPRRGLAALLQLGLQPLHGLQSSLGICGRVGGRRGGGEIEPVRSWHSERWLSGGAGAAPAVAL